MRQLKTRIMGTCAALLLGATFAASQGLDTSRTTIVTFSAPVVLPGVTLPAGSYMFRLADSQTNRNIVQVFDKDRTKIFATILAIPAQRNKPADETVITFKEAPASSAPAVQYWYYPGETMGQEFAYPKKQAMEIANAAHTSVLAVDMESDQYDATKGGEVSRVQPTDMAQSTASQTEMNAQPQTPAQAPTDTTAQSAQSNQPAQQPADMPSAKPEPAPAAEQTAQPSSANQPVGTSGTASADMPPGHAAHGVGTTTETDKTDTAAASADMPAGHMAHGVGTSGRRLPHTASPLPLIGLAGLFAIFGAVGVRALRKAAI